MSKWLTFEGVLLRLKIDDNEIFDLLKNGLQLYDRFGELGDTNLPKYTGSELAMMNPYTHGLMEKYVSAGCGRDRQKVVCRDIVSDRTITILCRLT